MTKKHWIMAALAAAVVTGGYFFMGDSTPNHLFNGNRATWRH